MKKLVKVLLVIALAMFITSCSSDRSEECIKLTVDVATKAAKAAGAEIPEEAKKLIQTAAEQGCKVCAKGGDGDACDALIEGLKKQ